MVSKIITFTLFLILLNISLQSSAQVGIGTLSPHPSSELEVFSTSKGLLIPRLTQAQRAAIANPADGLMVYQTDGNKGIYVFNSNSWIELKPSVHQIGDIKQGAQTADHSGWVKMDGRALSLLSASQQTAAASLGITGNLPNATDRVLTQTGTLFQTGGSNTANISQSNLPNITLNGNTSTDGEHNHTGTTTTNGGHDHTYASSNTILVQNIWGGTSVLRSGGTTSTSWNGNHMHSLNINNNGSHSHTVSVPLGGSATPLSVRNAWLSVNYFIYLGN